MAIERRTVLRALRIVVGLALVAVVVALVVVRPGTPRRAHPQREAVRFWHPWTGEWMPVVERIVERFNASQERWEVIALSIPPATAEQKFVMAVAGGQPPDLLAQLEQVLPAWASMGLVEPLDARFAPGEREAVLAAMYPAARAVGEYDGKLWALPIGMNAWACYYRPADLAAAGLASQPWPRTLEELMEWGRRLRRVDDQGRLTRMGYLPGWFAQYAPRFGGGFWDGARLSIDTPANLRALTFIADARTELGFDRVLRFESGLNTGGYATEWPFISGQVAIAMDGQWRIEQLARYAPGLEYRTAPLPPAAGGDAGAGYAAGNFLVIPRGAPAAEGAFAFMRFWSGIDDPERAAEFYAWGGWLPIAPRIAAAPAYQDYLRRYPQMRSFLDLLPSPSLRTAPPVPFQAFLLDEIRRAEEYAIRSSKTPAQALKDLAAAVQRELARRERLGAPR